MKFRLNFRFLKLLLVLLVVLGAAAFGLHTIQSARSVKLILRQAREAVAEGQIDQAVRHYQKYTSLVRNETQAETEYADLLADIGQYEAAFFRFEALLRRSPELSAVRKRLVEVALQLGRGSDAKSHLIEHLLPSDPENAELVWLLGRSELSMARPNEAVEDLELAVELDPADPRFTASLANLLSSQFARTEEAERVMNQLIEQAPENHEAYFARAQWLSGMGRQPTGASALLGDSPTLLNRAWRDAERGLELSPDSSSLAVLMAEIAVARRSPEDAMPVVERALLKNPMEPTLVIAAAELDHQAGDSDRALERLKDGLQAMPGQPDLLLKLAQSELQYGDDSVVPDLVAQLRSMKYPEPQLRYLEAQAMAKKGQWRETVNLLDSIRPQLDRSPATLSQVDYLLGLCYEAMGNSDQEVVALRRALSANPNFDAARQALASALYRAGRYQEAAGEYWNVVRRSEPPVESVLGLARLLLLDGLRGDGIGRDWTQLEYLIGILKEVPEAGSAVAILEAELLAARGQQEQSEETLRAALAQQPLSAPLHQAWIAYCVKTRRWDRAELALKTARESLGDTVPLRLEEARLQYLQLGVQESLGQLDRLATPADDFSEDERLDLASRMADLFYSLGEIDRAQKQAEIVASSERGSNNMEVHLLMFELALRGGQTQVMGQALERLRELEGQGPLWRVGRAIRYMVQAEAAPAEDVENRQRLYNQGMNQLNEAALLRPAWPRIPKLQGEIMERLGDNDAAVQHYLNAINLGDKTPEMVGRTIFLLSQQRRFLEADRVIKGLQDQRTPFSSDLARLATQVSLELQNYDRALELARQSANQTQSAEDRAWLAQVYSITGQTGEAERELKTLIEQQPDNPLGWVSLVQLYTRQKRLDDASAVIQQAREKLDERESADALAQCYESILDYTLAEQFYLRAAQERPSDWRLARRIAEFYLSIDNSDEAQKWLERLVDADEGISDVDRRWSRRGLAMVLGLQGDQQLSDRALELVNLNLQAGTGTLDDRRSKAFLLNMRPDPESLKEAIRLMESVVKGQPQFSLVDNFMLAEMHLRSDDWLRYVRTMRGVLGNGGADQAIYVRAFARALVERGELDEGQVWYERLKRLAPGDLNTAAVEARLLFRSGDFSRLIRLLERLGENDENRQWAADSATTFAAELKQSKKADQAEPLWDLSERFNEKLAQDSPLARVALVEVLAQRGQVERAMEMAEQWQFGPSELAKVVATVMLSGGLSDLEARKWLEYIETTLESHPSSAALSLVAAEVYAWVQDIDKSIAAYRRVLELEPENYLAANNFATLLALTGREPDTAMELVQRLISRLGPYDFLLDTRGLVHLGRRAAESAEADFRLALETSQTPEKYFHLALALEASGQMAAAQEAFEKALTDGLSVDQLHPVERPFFQRFMRQ